MTSLSHNLSAKYNKYHCGGDIITCSKIISYCYTHVKDVNNSVNADGRNPLQ